MSHPDTLGSLERPALPPTHVAPEGAVLSYLPIPAAPGLALVSEKPPMFVMEGFLTPEARRFPSSFVAVRSTFPVFLLDSLALLEFLSVFGAFLRSVSG
jgi:hypothetical protein